MPLTSGSKCPKCEKTHFEIVQDTPEHSSALITFVRCKSCLTVVGVLDGGSAYNAIHHSGT